MRKYTRFIVMIADIDKNGKATSDADAAARPVPKFEGEL